MRRKRSYSTSENAPENNTREHISLKGFSWSLTFPKRNAANLGQRKPLAVVHVEGYEDLLVPVAVAKELDSGVMPEPESHAELLYNIREIADKLAFQKIIDMVSRREYSSKEAADKLKQYGYSSSCAKRTVKRAQETRIINDKRFTESYIRSKVFAGWGPVRIERELSLRGIDASSLEGWPEAYFEDMSIQERAAELLSSKTIPSKNAYPKLVRYLVSRGYSMSVAKDAVAARLSGEEM